MVDPATDGKAREEAHSGLLCGNPPPGNSRGHSRNLSRTSSSDDEHLSATYPHQHEGWNSEDDSRSNSLKTPPHKIYLSSTSSGIFTDGKLKCNCKAYSPRAKEPHEPSSSSESSLFSHDPEFSSFRDRWVEHEIATKGRKCFSKETKKLLRRLDEGWKVTRKLMMQSCAAVEADDRTPEPPQDRDGLT